MEAPWEGQEKGLGKREKKPNQDSLQGTRARAWKPGAARRGSTRRELGFLPLGPSEGRRPSERKRPALSPARCPFVTATRPRQPPPPLPEANKSLRAAAAPPSQPPGPGPHLGEQAPARAPAPGPPLTSAGCAAHPPPSAAPTAAEINNLAGKGEPLFVKVSHFPADKPDPRPAHVFAGRGSRARVLRAGAPPLRVRRLFPPTRIRPRRAGGDSDSRHRLGLPSQTRARKMEEQEEGRQRGHAKGPPGRGERTGPRGGRAEAAPRRAHIHSHTRARAHAPTPPPAAPRLRGRAVARGTVQPVGDARQLQERPRPPPPRPPRGPRHPGRDGACPPAAPGAAPAQASSSPPTSPPPRQKERRRRRGRPGLSGAGFGGKPSFLSSFSSCCSFPPPPNSATPDPLRSSLGPSAANAVSAPADDSGLAGGAEARPQQSRGAGPRLRPRVELSEVCHFERGYGVARKRCRSVSAARGTRQPDTPSGEASGRGGQRRGSAHTYSWPSGSRVPAGPPPPHRLRGPVCTRRARLHPE
ncbi:unnamed protein product [Rangifer tarandus platyrhynchus]|uniref:Basic proline-rich protein-like n=1 Tax=Rangifer tarandus platyrhynchus TaxID=3082113 RepID=A0ABN8ZCS5_RANTA|nr:unnamed protein product [Rangifer tarandus platyrhynchus]